MPPSPSVSLSLFISDIRFLTPVAQADPVYPDIAIKPAEVEVEAVEEEEDGAEVDVMDLKVLLGELEALADKDGQGQNQTAYGMVQGPVNDRGGGVGRMETVTKGRERRWHQVILPWR